MGDDIQLGRLAGFPLRVNWSVLVVLWLFTWSLAGHTLPVDAPGHPTATYWLAGLAGAVVFLGSILTHELAHALVARRSGVEVKGLTLWMFGGIASFGSEAKTPRDDFRIAAAGPATSLILAAVFAGVAIGLDAFGVAHIVVGVAWWLAGINLLLGLFNLLPGAPLDGGRVLRAYLWHRHGDVTRAALGATRAGRVLAFGLIALGLVEFLAGYGLGGLWMVFIGWFLLTAARAEEAQVLTRQALAGIRVADVMSTDPHTGPGWLTVDAFIERYVLGDRHSAYPVEGPDGGIDGLITLAQLRAVPSVERATTRVRDVAIPLADVPTATPDQPLTGLLEHLSPDTGGRALIFDDGRLVGIITPTDIARTIDIRGFDVLPSAGHRH
ncbi:site-2 protease family protein [Lentzea sp. BCCO 10_0856]|uniref:Zinc metalloprotease n=1 Tax=Lentzea miocenica TaxID=3095431 RepID=A0ABU4T9J4_9PSEU|nr:site-2 protease family protein [Lentzea sp. BCCO 10_0856]MDX8034841.1 site-2 protease family protein [Lentzea sp. BCCO 10_0856]